MFSLPTLIATLCVYMAFLFTIALWVERKAAAGRDVGNNPVVYALSLAVYLSAWTFYGAVGKAASWGVLFITFYLGPTLVISLWWIMLRKMVRIKNSYRVTSLADFISLRYDKSASIAALVVIIAILAIVPYVALQLKAVSSSFRILGHLPSGRGAFWTDAHTGLLVAALLILFTIILGVRRLVPTERHQGMVVAMAAEGMVKLIAFLAVGAFVTYHLFGGIGDIFGRISETPLNRSFAAIQTDPSFYITWTTYLLLSMSAVMFLPRQFHMSVVENFNEKHIRTAMWLFPLYMILITIFVLPIALGGLLAGYPLGHADEFVLRLPISSGHAFLSMLVFIGGFASATGMIVISSMTISTMVTNHVLLPVIQFVRALDFLKRYLLQCRWATVAALILAGYWFEQHVGVYFTLVDIGVISFAGVLQLVPAAVGGIFWKKGNRAGALMGMGTGFVLWVYTLVLPAFARGGTISHVFLENGPWGIGMLRPEYLFGLTGFDPISHAVLWTMLFNVGLYVLGSLYVEQSEEERSLSEGFVNALAAGALTALPTGQATIDQAEKRNKIEELFSQYFPVARSAQLTEGCLFALKIEKKNTISIVELAELYNNVERRLASSIGAAAAHKAIRETGLIAPAEESALKDIYADIIAQLKLTPSDLMGKIDYYREREGLLTVQAAELAKRVEERDREIAERKRMEEALRNSQRQLTDIINFLPDATFVIDLEGRILIWNRTAEEMTGTKAEDMLGKGDYEYAIPFYGVRRPILIDLVLNPSEEIKKLYPHVFIEDGIVIGEAPTRSAKRGEGYMFAIAAPLYDSEGRIIGAIESVRDITDRKRAEEELEKHRDRLEELIKERTSELVIAKEQAEAANLAKSVFLASMSHELRTPLNAILGYAQILKRDGTLGARQAASLNTIYESGEHLLTLINDILDLSRIEVGRLELHPAETGLPPFLRVIADIIRVKAEEKRVSFAFEASPDLPGAVRVDEKRLRQVLLNLLGNAVKFTDEGQVNFRVGALPARETGQEGEPHIGLRFEVEDTGIGMTPEQLARIFRPFEQVADRDRREGGAGLGLAISRQLLRLMGSEIQVRSEGGKGSLFWFELDLPVAEVEVAQPITERIVIGYSGPRRKVLIVDDVPGNRAVLVDPLAELGFETFEAADGKEGLAQAQTIRPDLILMDIMMPVMDGLEATRGIRRTPTLKEVPVIAVSASASLEDHARSLGAGANVFVAKPIDLSSLLRQIGAQLNLTWIYKEPEEKAAVEIEPAEPLVPAPPEEMKTLHELALMGNMGDIRLRADHLQALGEQYRPFAERLRHLAARYQSKAILALVEHCMAGETST
jgi:signal transduction histidine kinase/Na+/proline symporter/CheY-like chemotaxis protein